jgi:hypothetical protein
MCPPSSVTHSPFLPWFRLPRWLRCSRFVVGASVAGLLGVLWLFLLGFCCSVYVRSHLYSAVSRPLSIFIGIAVPRATVSVVSTVRRALCTISICVYHASHCLCVAICVYHASHCLCMAICVCHASHCLCIAICVYHASHCLCIALCVPHASHFGAIARAFPQRSHAQARSRTRARSSDNMTACRACGPYHGPHAVLLFSDACRTSRPSVDTRLPGSLREA